MNALLAVLQQQIGISNRYRWWLVGVLVCAALVIYLPLLNAGFYSDDWTFLALSKHGDGPLGFFVYDHSYTYMYRPIAMNTWWALTRLFGLDAVGHYSFALVVHGCNALLVALLVWRVSRYYLTAFVAAGLFLVHPISAATVGWLADRFDLLMSLGVLSALVSATYLSSYFWRGFVLALVATLVAIGSKETGLALIPAIGLAVVSSPVSVRSKLGALAVLFITGCAYLLVRYFVLGSLGGVTTQAGSTLILFLQGSRLWFQWLPQALAGQLLPLWLLWFLLILGLMCSGLMVWHERLRVAPVFWMMLVLLVQIAVLQAPVTRHVLDQAAPFRTVVNFRFYYLALALLIALGLIVVRWALGRIRYPKQRYVSLLVVSGGLLALGTVWAGQSHQALVYWAQTTMTEDKLAVMRAAADLAQFIAPKEPVSGEGVQCFVRMREAAKLHTDLGGYSDLMVKALIPAGSSALNCIFVTEAMPWKAITDWDSYESAASTDAIPPNRAYSFRSGSLALHVKMAADGDAWRWREFYYRSGRFIAANPMGGMGVVSKQ